MSSERILLAGNVDGIGGGGGEKIWGFLENPENEMNDGFEGPRISPAE